jgi:hypothetical protein
VHWWLLIHSALANPLCDGNWVTGNLILCCTDGVHCSQLQLQPKCTAPLTGIHKPPTCCSTWIVHQVMHSSSVNYGSLSIQELLSSLRSVCMLLLLLFKSLLRLFFVFSCCSPFSISLFLSAVC